jgi:glycosyltransferase involved in cell wall biosynthesis
MAKKIKIIFLGKIPPPYIGPAVATEIILRSKLAEKYQLIHLDTSDHRDINTLGAFDLKNFVLPLWLYCKLTYLIIRHWPQAVYFPGAQTTVAFLRDVPFVLITKLFGKKVISHLRGGNFKNWYKGASSVTRWLVRHMQKMVDGQIVLGDCLVDMFADLMPRDKIFVVPNGGDFPLIPSKFINAENSRKKRILFLANFIGSKGVLEVLRSVPEVVRKFPAVEFLFVGSWRDAATKNEFTRFIEDHPGLPIQVMAPVIGIEKFKLLESADIFVFPTYYINEGHPWVIVEALASGLPIISTDHGAIKESVLDGVNGFLVEKKNTDQIVEKLLALLSDSELRKKMGKASRLAYESRFAEKHLVERMSSCFESVIREN